MNPVVIPVGDGITLAELVLGLFVVGALVGLLGGAVLGAIGSVEGDARATRVGELMFVGGAGCLAVCVLVLVVASFSGGAS